MQPNTYAESIVDFKALLRICVEDVVAVYGGQLEVGYWGLEQQYRELLRPSGQRFSFDSISTIIVKRLVDYTDCHPRIHHRPLPFKVEYNFSRTRKCYICAALYNGIEFLVRFHIEQENNDDYPLPSVKTLYDAYVATDAGLPKSLVVVRMHCGPNELVDGVAFLKFGVTECFCLEEVDLKGFKGSDALMLTASYRQNNVIQSERMSFQRTSEMLERLLHDGNSNPPV